MPGKYLEYIKAGQYVVPVEITFLSSKIKEGPGKEVGQTSKWVEQTHWKEIKAMLKPAVEAALKYNEQPVEKVSKSTHVSFGQEIGLGYVLGTNKDKSPFLAVLDVKKNCWTDDEEEPDENTKLRDHGGRHKNFTPTKVYVSCAILKKSGSQTEDGKRLRKELGSVNEDVRSYFQPPLNQSIPSGVDTTPITTFDKVNLLLGMSGDPAERKSGFVNQALNQNSQVSTPPINNTIKNNSVSTPTTNAASSDSASDIGGKKKPSGDHYEEEMRTWRYERKTIPNKNDSFWSNLNAEGSYYEERDEEAEDDDIEADEHEVKTKTHHSIGQEHNMQDLYHIDFDDDTFSLPDIDTPLVKSSITNSDTPEVEGFGTPTFKNFGTNSKLHNGTSNLTPRQNDKKKSPKKKSTQLTRSSGRFGSSDDSDRNDLSDHLLFDEVKSPTRKKRKRTNSVKHNTTLDSIASDSYSTCVDMAEALRAFEFRNIETSSSLIGSLGSTSTSQSLTSPEKKKTNDSNPLVKVGGFKKSPTMSPPRMQKSNVSPVLSRVTSPIHTASPTSPKKAKVASPTHTSKPTTPAKSGKTVGSPLVARKIFSTTSPPAPAANEIISPPSLPHSGSFVQRKENLHQEEVQILKVKPKRIRKSAARLLSTPTPSASTQPVTASKPSLNQITRIKKEKGLRRDTQQEQSQSGTAETQNGEVDPDMPILERMVYNVDPPLSITPAVLKVEPLSPSKASAEVLQTKPTPRIKRKRRRVVGKLTNGIKTSPKKNEATQTIMKRRPGRPRVRPLKISFGSTSVSPKTPVTNSSTLSISSTPVAIPSSITTPNDQTVVENHTLTNKTPDDVRNATGSQTESTASYTQAAATATRETVRAEDTNDNDLFSFDNLDKSPPKFSSVSTGSFGAISEPLIIPTRSTNGSTQKLPNQDAGGSMMPPPTKRPPRTPKKTPPVVPFAVRPPSDTSEFNGGSAVEKPDIRPKLATVGVQVNPSQLSTFELLSNPILLRAGMGMLNKYASDKSKSNQTDSNDEAEDQPARPKRAQSPDICSGPPNKTQREIESELMPAPIRPVRSQPGPSTSLSAYPDLGILRTNFSGVHSNDPPARSDSTEEESYLSDPDAQEGGEALVRELMSRYNNRDHSYYEPEGDEFDLSQRSYCMLNVVPDYQQKSRLYKMHSKNITALSQKDILQHFRAIIPEMVAIFQGSGSSDRHRMYLLGQTGRKHLKEMNVCVPFNNDHGMTLITLLFEYFVPDVSARIHWTDYINYVMLPECFIRIYSRVNELSYAMAETEMRYGACYDYENPDPARPI